MKKHLLIFALGASLTTVGASAQTSGYPTYPQGNNGPYGNAYPNYPQGNNAQYGNAQYGNVAVTSGPNVSNVSGNTATLSWTTDKAAANHVVYRANGENAWHSAFESGGSTNHSVTLSDLIPGRSYEFRILTRDNQVRTGGNFQTAGNGYGNGAYGNGAYSNGGYNNGTYNNGSYGNGSAGNHDRDNDAHRGDHDRDDAHRGDRDRDDAHRGDRDNDNAAYRGDHDNDANHVDRDRDRTQVSGDRDRYNKDHNYKDRDHDKKNKHNDKDKDDKDKDHDRDNSNPR